MRRGCSARRRITWGTPHTIRGPPIPIGGPGWLAYLGLCQKGGRGLEAIWPPCSRAPSQPGICVRGAGVLKGVGSGQKDAQCSRSGAGVSSPLAQARVAEDRRRASHRGHTTGFDHFGRRPPSIQPGNAAATSHSGGLAASQAIDGKPEIDRGSANQTRSRGPSDVEPKMKTQL